MNKVASLSLEKVFHLTAATAFVLALGVVQAKADVFVWRDVDTKMTASYPDTWRAVSNQLPGDALTLQAPDHKGGQNEFAECKINVADEGRFGIYPVRYSADIQHEYVSEDFWNQYLSQYNNVELIQGTDNNGLGRGFASMAQVNYETTKGVRMQKRSVGFASHYRGHIYTVECSAEVSAYHKWHHKFLSFVKSVDFNQGTNFAISGYYRDFLQDKTLKVRGPSTFEDTYY